MVLCCLTKTSAGDDAQKRHWSRGWLCGLVLLLLGVITLIMWLVMGQPESPNKFWEAIKEDFGFSQEQGENIWTDRGEHSNRNTDPFVGDNTTTAWKPDIIMTVSSNNQMKLRLEILNALDDAWQEEFQLAVTDWQQSDIIELIVTRVDADPSCTPVQGVIKVCNNDFGPTDWVGINDARIFYESNSGNKGSPGYIISSVAKMNDFYLSHTSQAGRQHAMCHELGHSLGLPHTDENPLNQDLGNCMDYTNRPENNLHPGEVNFQRLRSIYENFGGRSSGQQQADTNDNKKSSKRRALR